MSNSVTDAVYNANTGYFEVTSVDANGVTTTENVNFTAICMTCSLNSLNAQDEIFAEQMAKSQEQVNTLTVINECLEMFSGYDTTSTEKMYLEESYTMKVTFGPNGERKESFDPSNALHTHYSGDREDYEVYLYQEISGVSEIISVYYVPGSDADKWVNTYRPILVESGLFTEEDMIGIECSFYGEDLENFMGQLEATQTSLTGQNEQQMLITNDAAAKRTSILQMAQSIMQQAVDASKAAAQS